MCSQLWNDQYDRDVIQRANFNNQHLAIINADAT